MSNSRLESHFQWVAEDEYRENRQHFLNISRKQNKIIEQTFEYIWDHVQTELPGPSKVDALYIAHAIELDIPVVTDGQDMTELAHAFDAQVMPTLGLLRIMLDNGRANKKTINALCDYWRHIGDRPANLDTDFARLFDE